MENITTSSKAETLLLITEPSLTTTALIACLNNALSSSIILVEKHQLEEKLACHSGLVLIDFEAFDYDEANIMKKKLSLFAKQHIFGLFNTLNISAKDLASWPYIKGLFKKNDGLEQLCEGIRKLFLGEYWLPTETLTELLDFYQRNNSHLVSYTDICLTNREQQILCKLVTGASNGEIAYGLFVSEHTVKSHLYNIFKKINVKNRVQAIFWAKNNLAIIDRDYQNVF